MARPRRAEAGAIEQTAGRGAGAGGAREGRALVALALVLVFLGTIAPVVDFDIFYHLAIGDWILDHHAVPRTGLYSGTRGDAPWVDGEWGFQALVAAVHRAAGWGGLTVLCAFLPMLALALLARVLLRRGLPAAATAVTVCVVRLALWPLVLRPQLVTYVFFAWTLGRVLDLVDDRRRGLDPWLAPAFLLWANLHAGYFIGLVAIGLVAAVEAARVAVARARGVDGAGEPGPPASSPALLASLAGTWIAALAGACLNPYGFHQIVLPLRYLDPRLTARVQEWTPTVLANLPGYTALLGLVIAAVALAPRRMRVHDLALLVAFAVFSVRAHRHVGLGAFALAAAAAPSAASALGSLTAFAPWLAAERLARVRRLAVPAVLVLGFVYLVRIPERTPFRFAWEDLALPVSAADFLVANPAPGVVFNQYYMGGYLEWRLRPEAKVFIDGRNDLHGIEIAAAYDRIMSAAPGFEQELARHGVRTVLIAEHPNNARLLAALVRREWTVVHRSTDVDPPMVVLRTASDLPPPAAGVGSHPSGTPVPTARARAAPTPTGTDSVLRY